MGTTAASERSEHTDCMHTGLNISRGSEDRLHAPGYPPQQHLMQQTCYLAGDFGPGISGRGGGGSPFPGSIPPGSRYDPIGPPGVPVSPLPNLIPEGSAQSGTGQLIILELVLPGCSQNSRDCSYPKLLVDKLTCR